MLQLTLHVSATNISLFMLLTETDANASVSRIQSFSMLHNVQTDSEVHPTSYPMGTRGSFPGCKPIGA
jgi:hypothetical protein